VVGRIGELSWELYSGTSVISTYPIIPVAAAMNSFPKNIKIPPINVKAENLPKFLTITPKPLEAAEQKFSPVKAIWFIYFLLEYKRVC